MRKCLVWFTASLALTGTGLTALSITQGQEPSPITRTSAVAPAANAAEAEPPAKDLAKLTPLHRQMYLSAQRGAEWLYRANGVQGRFLPGYLPALKTPMEGDHYLRQVGAAFALARAARFTGDKRYAARATQAVLTLLGDTAADPKDPQVRHSTLPPVVANRLAAAGLLVLAIHELPAAEKDLLEQAEQLCNYVRRQQRADGSLGCGETPDDAKVEKEDPEGAQVYAGMALYGLARSQHQRPAAWKLDVLRKALVHYQAAWRARKGLPFVPWHTAAYTEAFLLTKDTAYAQFVSDMNDWLCTLQYEQFDARHPLWVGGFMGWADGKPQALMPQIGSAAYAESLAEACRVARETADLPRHQRYAAALERCLQFLTTLQYTEANTTHFANWYRPQLVGGFYASEQDGNLRLDYTQHAVSAMVQYLRHVARVN